MKAKHKLTLVAAGALLALAAGSAATAAERAARGPFDAKAREIFEKVISIPTSLGNRKVPEMAAYLAGEFRAAGFPAEDVTIVPFKLPDDETAALVVRYRGDGSGGKPILLLAHMDVVTAKASDWVRDPYKLVEENGFFYGRGTYDVKHGITELTTLFLRLKAEKFVPKRDLIIYFSGDEETSMATTVAVANKHRQLIDAEYALNSDGGGGTLDDDTGKPLFFGLQTAEKTYADFTLTTRNAGGHSSTPRADNAIYDLAAALVKLRQFSFPVMWNDTTVANFRAAAKTTPGELGAGDGEVRRQSERRGGRGHAGRESVVRRSDAHHLRGDHARRRPCPERVAAVGGRQCELPHLPGREDRRRARWRWRESSVRASR